MKQEPTYFYGKQNAPLSLDDEIAFLPVRYIPMMIEALEARKSSAVYDNEAAYQIAMNAICIIQWELLMGSADRIISEIRAMREGKNTPLVDRDPTLNPYTLELTSLRDIAIPLNGPQGTVNAILLRLEQLQIAANEGDAESLAELAKIAAIVVGI